MAGRASGLALLAALAVACARDARPDHGPPSARTQATPVSSGPAAHGAAAAEQELKLPEHPATVTFSELPPLGFRAGPPLRLRSIAKQVNIIGLSPDAKSWVLEESRSSRLVTASNPGGVVIDEWNGSTIFSADGRYVAVWSYQGSFSVLEVASGKLRIKKDVSTCALRFSSVNELLFHTASKENDAGLFRISLDTGRVIAIGGAPQAETCQASLDGKTWMVEAYDARWFVDGESGRRLRLPREAAPGIGVIGSLSSAGNRMCSGGDSGLSCVRYPDGRLEKVWARPSSDSYVVHDPAGVRALFRYVDNPEGVYDGFALVDFEARTVRPLKNVKGYSGSMFAFTHGGTLLTIGSGHGMHVYDIERGQKRSAAHNPLYGNFTFPYLPRVMVAGTDEPMDLFLIEVP